MKPFALLNRIPNAWKLIGTYNTLEEAERASTRIIGAWKWWGPTTIAEKMIADPKFDPDAKKEDDEEVFENDDTRRADDLRRKKDKADRE